MADYCALMRCRVEVVYRAGEANLSATGTVVADSGKSIFIEQQYSRAGKTSTFRWEIPYGCIVRVSEVYPLPSDPEPPAAAPKPSRARLRPARVSDQPERA
jgi:hypothetical protein